MSSAKMAGRTACRIYRNSAIAENIFEMVVEYPSAFPAPVAGQFVNLYCHHQGRLLPRPISVCEMEEDVSSARLRLVYAIQGAGTLEFSSYRAGETIDMLGPFGTGFSFPEQAAQALLIGGGVGTPPMVGLARRLAARGWQLEIVVGFRQQPYLLNSLERYGNVHVATDHGTFGFHGNVVELIVAEQLRGEYLFACGPAPMLRGVQELAVQRGCIAQVSLEERMGCGFGGCVGCVVKIAADNEAGFVYRKVCKDGPVFLAEEVLF